jgi:hypothetical protein
MKNFKKQGIVDAKKVEFDQMVSDLKNSGANKGRSNGFGDLANKFKNEGRRSNSMGSAMERLRSV